MTIVSKQLKGIVWNNINKNMSAECCTYYKPYAPDPRGMFWGVINDIVNRYVQTKQNVDFILYKGHAYIVDTTNVPENCNKCENRRRTYLFADEYCGYVSDCIKIALPFVTHNLKMYIKDFCNIKFCNAPNFGTFLYGEYSIDLVWSRDFIIYHPTKSITKLEDNICMVDGLPTICCALAEQKYILLNANGIVPGTQIVLSDRTAWVVENGQLNEDDDNKWTYTGKPATHTKSAARLADE